MERITSIQNEYIKKLTKLHSATARKESGLFLVEGAKLCKEAYESGWHIEKLLITEHALNTSPIKQFDIETILISDHVAKKLSTMDTTPGVFAVVRSVQLPIDKDPKFILAFDHLSDPSNLGAVFRSAEAFGTKLIYLSDGSVDPFSPKVIRAAMGSLFRVPFRKGTLASFIAEKKEMGYQIIGAGLNRNFKELPDISFSAPTVLIIGNESNGISDEIMQLCDFGLFIPMLGENESLNAAVAASIILWEQSKWN